MILADYAVKFNFFLSAFYFNSFHFLVIVILLSLLRGLIWEVFIVIDNIIKPETTQSMKSHLFFTKVTTNIAEDNNNNKRESDPAEARKVTLIKGDDMSHIIVSPKIRQTTEKNTVNSNGLPVIEETNEELKNRSIERSRIEMSKSSYSDKNNENIVEDSFDVSDNKGKTKLLSSLYVYNQNLEPFAFHQSKEPKINREIYQPNPNENKEEDFEDKEVELIQRKKKENFHEMDSGTINIKNEVKSVMSDKQKSWIKFYKQKIKRLRYFLQMQEKKRTQSENKREKFDENSHFFDGKDKLSMNVLEEFLINNLEDEEVTDSFLPEKKNFPLESMKSMKVESAAEKKEKKKTQGVNYGNSKDFLLKKAFLKDLNMEQIQVLINLLKILVFRSWSALEI